MKIEMRKEKMRALLFAHLGSKVTHTWDANVE